MSLLAGDIFQRMPVRLSMEVEFVFRLLKATTRKLPPFFAGLNARWVFLRRIPKR